MREETLDLQQETLDPSKFETMSFSFTTSPECQSVSILSAAIVTIDF